MGDLELKVYFLTDDAEKAADLQKTVSARGPELNFKKSVLATSEAALKVKIRNRDQSNLDLGSTWTVFDRAERLISDFAEQMCTGYTLAMHGQAGDYRDLLNALIIKMHKCVRTTLEATDYVLEMTVIPLTWGRLIVTRSA